jgi:hypothetical protein
MLQLASIMFIITCVSLFPHANRDVMSATLELHDFSSLAVHLGGGRIWLFSVFGATEMTKGNQPA